MVSKLFAVAIVLACAAMVVADITAVAPWYQKTSTSFPRMEVFVCKFTTEVYIMGGYYTVDRGITNVIEKYDFTTNVWTTSSVTMPQAIHHADSATYAGNGKCYIAGGFITSSSAPIVPIASFYSFDGTTVTTLTSMPTARGALTVEIVGDCLYAIGGANVYNQDQKAVLEVYNITTGVWTAKASMNYAREHLTSGVVAGKIYAMFGRASGNRGLTYNEVYDPSTDVWSILPAGPTGRSGAHAVAIGDKVYAFGGETNRVFDNVEAYQPSTSSWICYQPMPNPRHGTGAVAYGTQAWTFVGGPTSGPSLSVTAFYLETSTAVNVTCGTTNYPYADTSTGSNTATSSSSSTALFVMGTLAIASLLA